MVARGRNLHLWDLPGYGITAETGRLGAHSRATALYSLTAAAACALTDTLIQHWSVEVGVVTFVAVMFSFVGILPAPYTCRRSPPSSVVPAAARNALLLGAGLLGAQNLVMALAIRYSGDATAVNIVYSSRCVLSVVLAWVTARWLGSREATLPRGVLFLRLAGALLLAGAILMVMI
jgi:hypothetical protein